MPHRKHTNEDLVEIIRTMIQAHDAHFRNPDDQDIRRILKEVIEYARAIVTPTEFKAERCPDTDEMPFMKSESPNHNQGEQNG
jgi:hypothetical protein